MFLFVKMKIKKPFCTGVLIQHETWCYTKTTTNKRNTHFNNNKLLTHSNVIRRIISLWHRSLNAY